MTEIYLKGDKFVNRYRIEGTLKTLSPFHLGNGTKLPPGRVTKKNAQNNDEPVEVTAVDSDHLGKPRIPGSSLKGSLRGYLLNVFEQFQGNIAADRDFEASELKQKKQAPQVDFMRNDASHLERLFGTPFTESKIDVEDASCITLSAAFGDVRHAPYWDGTRLTYVETGVAIDPKTRTALDEKLYHFEAVPPGVSFKMAITGQNLTELELGLLLFGLKGFNSDIWPLTLGSMSGAGFGRFEFTLGDIHRLKRDRLAAWVIEAAAADYPQAGYGALDKLGEADADELVKRLKKALADALQGGR